MEINIDFNKNEDLLKQQLYQLKNRLKRVYAGGGESRIKAQHDKGKLTARERIHYLLDDSSDSLEIGALAGEEMYVEHGGCPSGGVVVVVGYVKGRLCVVVANDATVKAGAWLNFLIMAWASLTVAFSSRTVVLIGAALRVSVI